MRWRFAPLPCPSGSLALVRRVLVRAGLVVALLAVVVVVVWVAVVVFFYLNGGMWPGTHSNPDHVRGR